MIAPEQGWARLVVIEPRGLHCEVRCGGLQDADALISLLGRAGVPVIGWGPGYDQMGVWCGREGRVVWRATGATEVTSDNEGPSQGSSAGPI